MPALRAGDREAGGIDIQILGIGTNGHIGFNEPAPGLEARTHRVTLEPETRRSNAALFGGQIDRVPTEALSMGMATILQARAVILLAHGERKAACIAAVVNGPLTTELPASFLQLHHDVDLILDTAAASALDRPENRALPIARFQNFKGSNGGGEATLLASRRPSAAERSGRRSSTSRSRGSMSSPIASRTSRRPSSTA